MKTLNHHTLVYDDDCPLCRGYSQLFIDFDMLDEKGKIAFDQLPLELQCHIDQVRSRNEIALINRSSGEVTYGIHSLLKVIGNGMPVLQPLFKIKPFVWLAKHLYSLVSYNRKVIMPVDMTGESCGGSCRPSFHLGYRMLFLLFTWLITAFVLFRYSDLLTGYVPPTTYGREFLMCGGQLLVQGIVLLFLKKEQTWEYLGNMMTISLIGGLLLIPALCIGMISTWINPFVYLLVFLLVVVFMLHEHLRRTKLLGLGLLPTVTWVLYRIVFLVIILLPWL